MPGMDPRFPFTREDLYNLQMDMKQVQTGLNHHAERLTRLEKRQEQDAHVKSVWQSPFPGVLAGTPQQGPTHAPSTNGMFDDLDEHGDHLLSSLHLGPAEEEPARRGAASRANSVRFDESALRGSDWAGQNNRHSGEFGPIRPGSGLMMERSLSHKSDGRHSSAGHSVHSLHSVASGRASSLGMDPNFMVSSHEDDSPIDIPEPPPGFFVLGSVPSIINCWLTLDFAHSTILYADICTGSQKSVLEYSLVKELDLVDELQRDLDGAYRIRLPIFLTDATVTRASSRPSSPVPRIPSISAMFEVVGTEQSEPIDPRKGIRIFIGSDTLRAHSADVLLSQNRMTMYGNEREKLSVPFARPEDDSIFRHLCTTNIVPEKPKLNATATPFVSGEPKQQNLDEHDQLEAGASSVQFEDTESHGPFSPMASHSHTNKSIETSNLSESGGESERLGKDASGSESGARETSGVIASSASADGSRRESGGGIWGSWRQGTSTNGSDSGQRESGPLSGYQPAGRGGRNMKVLKPQKSGTSTSARTGAAYEPPPPPRTSGELRRKSQTSAAGERENGTAGVVRWEVKRSVSVSTVTEPKAPPTPTGREAREARNAPPLPRSVNPVGGASAFSWMNPASKAKPTAAAE